jgi:hypothetical protein
MLALRQESLRSNTTRSVHREQEDMQASLRDAGQKMLFPGGRGASSMKRPHRLSRQKRWPGKMLRLLLPSVVLQNAPGGHLREGLDSGPSWEKILQ